MDNYIVNKERFLEEVYNNEETKSTLISNYKNNIMYQENILGKDLMNFTTDEISAMIKNTTGVSQGYLQSMFSFCNSYCEWAVDKNFISFNPCASLSPSEMTQVNTHQLIKGMYGLNQFTAILSRLESGSTILPSTILSLLVARAGVLGDRLGDIIHMEEKDIKDGYINVYNKTNNSIDYGILKTSIPLYPQFNNWYEKYKDIKFIEGMGTRKSKIIFLESPYLLKRNSYANNKNDSLTLSPNSILNSINNVCMQIGIPRISLSKLQTSRKLDLLFDIRKNRRLNEKDFRDIHRMISYNSHSPQSLVNFKLLWKNLGGDDIVKGTEIIKDEEGFKYVEDMQNRIGFY